MTFRLPIPVLAAAAIAAGCALAGTATAHGDHHHTTTQKVTLRFVAVAGSTPVTCGTPITGLGTGSTDAQLQDLRFYVSNVLLVRTNGTTVPLTLATSSRFNLARGGNRVTLIDLENGRGACTSGDAATNAVISGTVPTGTYVGARMYMGVPYPLNHTDTTTAPAPLDITAMTWSWQSGRKFAKIEVTDPGTGTPWATRSFFVHLGSTGCAGNPATGATVNCTDSNRMSIRFAKFNPTRQRIAVDLRALLAGNDITVNRAGAPGCMSGPTDPECGPVFDAMQIDWRADGGGTGASIARGSQQRLFRVIAR